MAKQRKDTGVLKVSVFTKLKNECEKHNIILLEDQYKVISDFLEKSGKLSRLQVNTFCSSFLIPYATYNTIQDTNNLIERYIKCNALGFAVTEEKLKLKYGDIEGSIRWESRKSNFGVTKEKMIIKHGLEEGTKKWDSYCNKQAETNTLAYKSKKHGMTQEDFNEYNASRAVTKENLIKRYGIDEGIKKWNAYVERQSYAGCKLEYFIEKYGEIEGKKQYDVLNKKKVQSYENYIRKYGDIEGKEKWESYLKNSRNLYSVSSQNMFDLLYDNLKLKYFTILYARLNYEKYLYNLTKSYKYDFCVEDKKIIIEFNGDFYHANPNMYIHDDILNLRYKKIKAQDIWDYDKTKIKFAEDAGYKVVVVWESDFKQNKEKIINDLLEIIKNEPIK